MEDDEELGKEHMRVWSKESVDCSSRDNSLISAEKLYVKSV